MYIDALKLWSDNGVMLGEPRKKFVAQVKKANEQKQIVIYFHNRYLEDLESRACQWWFYNLKLLQEGLDKETVLCIWADNLFLLKTALAVLVDLKIKNRIEVFVSLSQFNETGVRCDVNGKIPRRTKKNIKSFLGDGYKIVQTVNIAKSNAAWIYYLDNYSRKYPLLLFTGEGMRFVTA